MLFEDDQLELFPYESQMLALKNASFSFSFGSVFQAMNRDQGKIMHMFEDFLKRPISFYVEKLMDFDEYEKLDKKLKSDYFVLYFKD